MTTLILYGRRHIAQVSIIYTNIQKFNKLACNVMFIVT